MSDLLHNAALFVALLWAPRHFYWSADEADRVAWTSDAVKAAFSKQLSSVYVLLADNTEFMTESSDNLILQSFLFSSKAGHAHSVKLFTVTSSRHRLVWRAPLAGGVTKEITGVERFLESVEYKLLQNAGVKSVYMFTDRGFRDLHPSAKAELHLLTPGLLDAQHTYPAGHCAWREVRHTVHFICVTCLQWQEGVRANVEVMNKFIKLSRIFSHAGLHHAGYLDLEFYVEILCALGNMRAADPPTPAPLAKSGERFTLSHLLRLHLFASLYRPPPVPSNLLKLNPVPPMWPATPAQEHLRMWRDILAAFPNEESVLSEALSEHAKQLLHDAKRAEYLPQQVDYLNAVWTHRYLDHRARALVSTHYVLLIQFCMAHRVVPPQDGRFAYYVQATVHASQRSHHRHFPRIAFDVMPPPKPFRWHSAACSCEDGCVPCIVQARAHSVTEWTASARTYRRSYSRSSTPNSLTALWYAPFIYTCLYAHPPGADLDVLSIPTGTATHRSAPTAAHDGTAVSARPAAPHDLPQPR